MWSSVSANKSINKRRTIYLVVERHVFLRYNHTAHAFLAVPRTEFVTYFGPSGAPDFYLCNDTTVISANIKRGGEAG